MLVVDFVSFEMSSVWFLFFSPSHSVVLFLYFGFDYFCCFLSSTSVIGFSPLGVIVGVCLCLMYSESVFIVCWKKIGVYRWPGTYPLYFLAPAVFTAWTTTSAWKCSRFLCFCWCLQISLYFPSVTICLRLKPSFELYNFCWRSVYVEVLISVFWIVSDSLFLGTRTSNSSVLSLPGRITTSTLSSNPAAASYFTLGPCVGLLVAVRLMIRPMIRPRSTHDLTLFDSWFDPVRLMIRPYLTHDSTQFDSWLTLFDSWFDPVRPMNRLCSTIVFARPS